MLFLVMESNAFLVCLCLGYVGCVMPWVLSVGLFVMISVCNPFFINQKTDVMKKKHKGFSVKKGLIKNLF